MRPMKPLMKMLTVVAVLAAGSACVTYEGPSPCERLEAVGVEVATCRDLPNDCALLIDFGGDVIPRLPNSREVGAKNIARVCWDGPPDEPVFEVAGFLPAPGDLHNPFSPR